jgi:hypothetical protein
VEALQAVSQWRAQRCRDRLSQKQKLFNAELVLPKSRAISLDQKITAGSHGKNASNAGLTTQSDMRMRLNAESDLEGSATIRQKEQRNALNVRESSHWMLLMRRLEV